MPNTLSPVSNIASDYLNQAFQDLGAVVQRAVTMLEVNKDRFEGIVVRGTSGLLVGPMVASELKKPWCIVRKVGDGTHSSHKLVEGWFGFKTYIIIDDLIATGGTLKAIQQTMNHQAASRGAGEVECVGYYLYNFNELVWRGDGKNYAYQDKYFIFPELLQKARIETAFAEKIAAAANYRPNALKGAATPLLPGLSVPVTQ